MSNFTYENQGTSTYLVYKISENDTVDSMSLGMLTNNKISGLASTVFTQKDATKYIYYNVSSQVSVKQFFSAPVNKKRLLGVFAGIVNAMLSAEYYMIDTSTIVMDLNYMFANVSTCETLLICLPILKEETLAVDLGMFFKNIMFSTQFDQTENCDYIATIINYLNSAAKFSLTEFKDVLDNIDKTSTVKSAVYQNQPVVTKPQINENVITQSSTQTVTAPYSQSNVINNQVQSKEPIQQQIKVSTKQVPNYMSKAQVASTPSNIPVPKQISQKPMPVANSAIGEQKKMSWFYLMQHYNKENAAAYKAQKAAKKNANKASATVQVKSNNKQFQVNSNFAVPVQNNNSNFAIPGQPTPPSNPQKVSAIQVMPQQNMPKTVIPTQQPTYAPRQVPQGQSMNFGETTVLGGGVIGETTVLTATQNPNKMIAPHLIRKKNNEKISLNKPVFRVGKERSYVDYFIGDNTAISRSHANIITRNGEYFVVDTNSTNHTFVNGKMIQSNVETAISDGDNIRFANEDFEFKLY